MTPAPGTFQIFSAHWAEGRYIDLSEYGIAPATTLDPFRAEALGSEWNPDAPDAREKFVAWLRGQAQYFNMHVDPLVRGPLILDIEGDRWPHSLTWGADPAVAERSIRWYAQTARLAHEALPKERTGFYGVAPITNYDAATTKETAKRQRWYDDCARLKSIGYEVDAVYPSLYTTYEDSKGWQTFARRTIARARAFKRPVYAFLWYRYHNSSHPDTPFIERDYWRLQLETCAKYADGVVIWGWEPPTTRFDADAPWLAETRAFMGEHGLN